MTDTTALQEAYYAYQRENGHLANTWIAFRAGVTYGVSEVTAEVEKLKKELEVERIRLAACGVVALSNTPESAAKAREMRSEYRSDSCAHVERAVDREMALRAENEELRADAERFQYWFANAPKPEWFAAEYIQGIREGWPRYRWRKFIDECRGVTVSSPEEGERLETVGGLKYAINTINTSTAKVVPAPNIQETAKPIDMILFCPCCRKQHIDRPAPYVEGAPEQERWDNPPHCSHQCQSCGHVWRPADVPTKGVRALKTKIEGGASTQSGQQNNQPEQIRKAT